MAQIKIFGLKSEWSQKRTHLSQVIHQSVIEVFKLPEDKRFHRFLWLESEDFIFPPDRSEKYLIIEISIFEGRNAQTIKTLIKELIRNISKEFSVSPNDIEITVFETPKRNWGIRGTTGDELNLSYKVEV